jgi:uncharacterized protein (TIGR04562 family)
MQRPFEFQKIVFDCNVGGVSSIDTPRLNIFNEDQAKAFVAAYGYDLNSEADRDQLWATHRRAVSMIQEHLLETGETIPEDLADPQKLQSIERLLMIASYRDEGKNDQAARELQRWSCAILRVMHVYVHLRNDLFSAFSDEIQNQILKPIQDYIVADPAVGSITLGKSTDQNPLRLHKFEVKPFKTTASSVIKLLARPERVALTLLDKLGVRFVTKSVYDSFRVIKFLNEHHIISYPHNIPDQSVNTLYPINIFVEAMKELEQKHGDQVPDSAEIEAFLQQRLERAKARAEYVEKPNEFSGPEYRFLKFITRKLITVQIGAAENLRDFRFFYPFEIQIMDYTTYVNNLSGPMAHDEYKRRQKLRARDRVLGELVKTSLVREE